jgi:ferric-dicitrate binding protein FerR (iron transport regulator)
VRDPRRFLLRVARNIAVSETRRHRNKTTDYLGDSSALDVHTHDRQITPEKQLDGRQKLALLAKAIASLPEEDQDILLMRKMEHLKFKQIAIRMNLSVSAVQMSRYTDISIEIQGEALAATPVAGYFRTGKVDALLEALELMGGIEIEWIDARHVRLISSDLEQ